MDENGQVWRYNKGARDFREDVEAAAAGRGKDL
jgi:hypothetical protein